MRYLSNVRLEGLNLKDFSKLLGVTRAVKNVKLPKKEQPSIHMGAPIPASFDARKNW